MNRLWSSLLYSPLLVAAFTFAAATPLAPEHNRLERLYLSHAHPDSGIYKDESLAVLMLFTRYAQRHPDSRIHQYLAADLVPIFELNPTRFLQTLGELPSVTQPVCNRLAAFFRQATDTRKPVRDFVEQYRSVFEMRLNPKAFQQCMQEFE